MFCGQCGNEVKDGVAFCGKCGAKVTKVEDILLAEETPVEATPEVEVAPEVEVVPEVEAAETESTQMGESTPQQAPKKKKAKAPMIILIVLAVVAVLVGGFFVFKDAIINRVMFLLPAETQFQYVFKNAAEDFVEKTNEYVAKINKTEVPTEGTTTGTFSVTVGDFIKSALENQIGCDLGDIDTVYADYEVAYNENQYMVDMGIGLEETDLLTMNVIMDFDKGSMAISVPELSDTAIEADMKKDMEISEDDLEEVKKISKEATKVVKEVLPEEELLDDLVPRYVAALITAIDEVEREKDTLEVGEVSQQATTLTIILDEDMMDTICKAVVEELENDEKLQTYIKETMENIAKLAEEEFDEDDFEDLYDEFVSGVEEMFESIGETDEIQDGLELVIWINSNNEIIGVVIDEYLEVASANDGEQVAWNMIISEKENEYVKVISEGKKNKKDGSFEGDVKVYVEESEAIDIEVGKYCLTDEKFELDADVKLGKSIGEAVGVGALIKTASIGINVTSTTESAEIGLSGKFQGSDLLSIDLTTKGSSEAKITYPKEAKGLNEADEWLRTVDFSTVLDNLDEVGVFDILGVDKNTIEAYIEDAMQATN